MNIADLRRRGVLLCAGCALLSTAPVGAQQATLSGLLTDVQAKLDSVIAHSSIPGITVGLALRDGTMIGFAAGLADTARGQSMDPSSRMLAGSVGKTYFAALALDLVAEGRLDLDAKVSAYVADSAWFAGLPNADDITVRMLMNHTSGIVRYELNEEFGRDLTRQLDKTWTVSERLHYVQNLEPPFAAGEGWTYSDTNYIILGAILQSLVGSDLYAEIRERFLVPNGLENTVPSDRPVVPGLVQGYAGANNPLGGFDAAMADGRLIMNPQFEWAGGGYASTAEDLAKWVKTIHEGEAFEPALLEEARDGVAAPFGPDASYGLAVIMLQTPAGPAWGHSGFMPGYRTEMFYFPRYRVGVALQINTTTPRASGRPLPVLLAELAQMTER